MTFHSIERTQWRPARDLDLWEECVFSSGGARITAQQLERAQREFERTRIRLDVLLREAERLRDETKQLEEILNRSAPRVAPAGDAGAAMMGASRSYERLALRKLVEKARGLVAVDALIERAEADLALLEPRVEKESALL